jgi:exosortase
MAVVLFVSLGVFVTLDAWRDMLHVAMVDDEQSHVLLVPFVAAALLWVRRERLRNYVPKATWVGPAFVALGWALNRYGDSYNVLALWHLGAIVIVVGGFLTVVGGAFLFRFFPVFASLLFLVPVPGMIRQEIAIPLQAETAHRTQQVLETLGVTVERAGNTLRINQQDVVIAEDCNGLRMVFALVMVSFVFAYSVPLRNRIRVLVIVASPITAILFNVLRLVPTVWAFCHFPASVASAMHDAGGWVMLPCAFFALLGLMRLLRWAQIPVTHYVLTHGA